MRRFRKLRNRPDGASEGSATPRRQQQPPLLGALGGLRIQATAEGIALIGEVDLATRELLAQALEMLEQATAATRIVIDLSGLTFLDGRGASLIADAARRLGPARTLVLRGAGQSVRTVLDALRLEAADNVVLES